MVSLYCKKHNKRIVEIETTDGGYINWCDECSYYPDECKFIGRIPPTIADLNRMENEHAKMKTGIKNLIKELERDNFYKDIVNTLRGLIEDETESDTDKKDRKRP